MKIADSALLMQSSYSFSQQVQSTQSLRMWVNPPADPSLQPLPPLQVDISVEAHQLLAGETAVAAKGGDDGHITPEMRLIKSLVELLTGLKIRLFDPNLLTALKAVQEAPDPNAPPQAPQQTGFGATYDSVRSYSESRSLTLDAKGIIKTSDGREIKFDFKLEMSYQYSETSQTSVRLGDAARKVDPLVLNFDGAAAQLSDQTFAFDLNGDGEDENISLLQPGNGFLALDRNGDGKIDSGKELFGPSSGDGFRELAGYDSDGNGWIDESDPVFEQLKVWRKDASGEDRLSGLGALGVGALSLHSISTPFDLKTAGNKTLGSLRSSGVYLNEDGTAGSLQQLDLMA